MKKRTLAAVCAALLLIGVGAGAYSLSPTVHPGRTGEAPEFGRTGAYSVGTIVREFSLPGRTRIGTLGLITGSVSAAERELAVRFWYPAEEDLGADTAVYSHIMAIPDTDAVKVVTQGIAIPGAPPITTDTYPLILMSHGYRGWSTQFSNLAEHIASRGYIVASIDHADMPATSLPSLLVSFGNVLVDRTQDQRQVLTAILAQSVDGAEPVLAAINRESIGLIGYSMGGYGALATAGATYDFSNTPLSNIPKDARAQLTSLEGERTNIDALVTFAPWGGAPDNRAWAESSLANITVPTMIIAGNQDDVVDFENGIKWIYDSLQGTDRRLLVLREARHNIVGNDFTLPADAPFAAIEFLKEPVWRSDRLNAINQHFVAVFLDLHLKGDTAKAAYLDLPTTGSNASQWPIGFREQLNGSFAGPEQPKHWKGFQRRWAVGLEMYAAPAQDAEPEPRAK
ncbi:alpha/beta hydrolase family protein [Pontixanthobacter sp.]|uniref:alpha/beta hydrolase family protein n=1 Tax=Pontixanthobacter sp. TaxID=2792078 RepID=UPI003C7DD11E